MNNLFISMMERVQITKKWHVSLHKNVELSKTHEWIIFYFVTSENDG